MSKKPSGEWKKGPWEGERVEERHHIEEGIPAGFLSGDILYGHVSVRRCPGSEPGMAGGGRDDETAVIMPGEMRENYGTCETKN